MKLAHLDTFTRSSLDLFIVRKPLDQSTLKPGSILVIYLHAYNVYSRPAEIFLVVEISFRNTPSMASAIIVYIFGLNVVDTR